MIIGLSAGANAVERSQFRFRPWPRVAQLGSRLHECREAILATQLDSRWFTRRASWVHLRRDVCWHPVSRSDARDVRSLRSPCSYRRCDLLARSRGFTFWFDCWYQPFGCPTLWIVAARLLGVRAA